MKYRLIEKDSLLQICDFDSPFSPKELVYAVIKTNGKHYKPFMYQYDINENNVTKVYVKETTKNSGVIEIG